MQICRKVVKTLLLKKSQKRVTVSSRNLDKFLGVRRWVRRCRRENQIGQVTGLARTEVGGELLTINVSGAARQGTRPLPPANWAR